MIWRWESRGWWLWSCGQEGGRTSLLFASSAMHSIAFDVQSTGSLLISMMDNSILLINIIFITNIMWPLPRIPFGRRAGHDWVFCCWRANEESHETICGGFVTFLGVTVRCWHIVPTDNRTFMLESNTISYWTGHYEWSSGTKKLLGWHKASVDFRCILFHCSYSLGKFSVI